MRISDWSSDVCSSDLLRRRRAVSAPAITPLAPHLQAFLAAADSFAEFIRTAPAVEEETATIAERFAEMAQALDDAPVAETPAGLVRLLVSQTHRDLCTKSGSFPALKNEGKWVAAAKPEGLVKADGERPSAAAEGTKRTC